MGGKGSEVPLMSPDEMQARERDETPSEGLDDRAREVINDVYFRFHALRKSHAAASLALSLVMIGLYLAMLVPSLVTVSLEQVEEFAGISCVNKGTEGTVSVRHVAICSSLANDEMYVQTDYTLSTADVIKYACVDEDGQSVELKPQVVRYMGETYSFLFFLLPIGKGIDTFLAVFYVKSAVAILMAFGAAGLTLCTTMRLEKAKQHVMQRSCWIYVYPFTFLSLALLVYCYGYFLMCTQPSDFCMLDRRFGVLEAVDLVPGLVMSTLFFLFQIRSIIKSRVKIERDVYLFDPDRPFAWFRVLAAKHYQRARFHRMNDGVVV